MKHTLLLFFSFFFLILQSFCYSKTATNTDKELIIKANNQIQSFIKDSSNVKQVIKVVYFHAKNQAPLNQWKERLPRTLTDVSKFYQEEFLRYGIVNQGLPFEKANGEIVLHEVEGDSASHYYNISSTLLIVRQIMQKTKNIIDFNRDHVLIISGLCDRLEDGSYFFHAPYGGTGSKDNGICFVADCELMDTKLLNDSVRKMTFSEMAVANKTCSVAEFNSWYIGGIAHEMGHTFTLSHDFGGPDEFDKSQISLMGEFGSRHFRDYRWAGEKTASFSTAGILLMLSQPIFTGFKFNGTNNTAASFRLSSSTLTKKDSSLILFDQFESKEQPYGAVALIRPTNVSEYLSNSFSCFIDAADHMYMNISKLEKGNYALKQLFLFPNGAVRPFEQLLIVDENGNAKIVDVTQMMAVDIQKLNTKLEFLPKSPTITTKLEILKGILSPPAPIDLKTFKGKQMYLSDAKWEDAKVGWEKVTRNYFTLEREATFFLVLHGKLYSKGLYAHSPSLFVFDLNKKWKTFSATIGLRDMAHTQGSARFKVIGDGKVLYVSNALRVNQKEAIKVDISGIKELKLTTEGTEGHTFNSWAIWVDPLLEK